MAEKVSLEQAKEELTPEELESAKSFGLIEDEKSDDKKEDGDDDNKDTEDEKKDDDDSSDDSDDKSDDDDDSSGDDDKEEDDDKKDDSIEHSSDLDESFDEMSEDPEKEHTKLQSFDKSQKAFYWKWKKSHRAKQDAVAKSELQDVRIKALEDKLNKALEKKSDSLDDLIDGTEKKRAMTVEEFEAHEAAKQEKVDKMNEVQMRVKKRMIESGQEVASKHKDFKQVADLANDLMKKDKSGNYYQILFAEAEKPDGNPAEFVYKLGRLHPNYKKTAEQNSADKLLKQKRQTSAALKSATDTNKKVSANGDYSKLTIEQAAELSATEWKKVPRAVRDKLLA